MKTFLSRPVRALKARLAERWLDPFAHISFAQEGEDIVLHRIFEVRGEKPGFYVDVGAHHPARFSNTYFFYRRGWRGINIDAMPGSMKAFMASRPRDVNLEVAIAETSVTLTYYSFTEPALNTFCESLADTYRQIPDVRLLTTTKIACQPLSIVLEEALPSGTQIDFLSVDVEGLDLGVLRSNDWSRFRPSVLLVEVLDAPDLVSVGGHAVTRFLATVEYAAIAKTANTLFFRDLRAPTEVA